NVEGAPRQAAAEGAHADKFYDAASFQKGLEAVRQAPPPARTGTLVGGLVPHHNLAGAMFTTFFTRLEAHPPKTIIVVGPNHYLKGQRVVTGRRGWATNFGVVEADTALVESLAQAGLATVDDGALENEHSMGALMPYVKYHAPRARVVPIILHKDVTIAEQEQLARRLAPLLSADTLLVASVDFSHYLPRDIADAKDVVTRQAIADFDLPAIMRMSPDYVDSPPSLGVLMQTMRLAGAAGPVEEAHTNSGYLLGSTVMETTSYFTFTYWMQQ
ncbi:MAG TPA: AmmeMemoRadiSam system protein B, partial [Symbiobacteriaceae bacterium]|nr:AmmeMemoRadiSam system protein B [Symbiobacteriaceae bacterium]